MDDLVVGVDLDQIDRIHGRSTVIADEELSHYEVPPSVQAPNLEGEVRWVLSAPFAEVLDALIALIPLRELKDGVIGIDLMCDVLVLTRVLPVALQLGSQFRV
jgi:hypothetical protein